MKNGKTDVAVETEANAKTDDTQSSTPQSAEARACSPEALQEAERKAEENRNQYLRTAAELENLRKRAQRDIENAHKFALERFAAELLAVKDSLEMGLAAVAGSSGDETIEKLREGKHMTLKLLSQIFEKFGINEIDPAGQVFDPELHEAMAVQPTRDAKPDTVVTVVQKGYTLNGRLLRPARVLVAKAPDDTTP